MKGRYESMLELKKIAQAALNAGLSTFIYGGTLFTLEHTLDRQYAVMFERQEFKNYKRKQAGTCWECVMYIYSC